MKLTALDVKKEIKNGLHSDGNGLYLKVQDDGSKSWIYRYQIAGHRRAMGLGPFPAVSLASARKERDKQRLSVKAGIDPLFVKQKNQRDAENARKKAEVLLMTFDRCSEEYITIKSPEWKNAKHLQQWQNTLATYVSPFIGDMPVEHIDVEHVLEVLNPIWLTKTETATRVRNRIELVLDYASARKYRSIENPARWRGNLEAVLPKPSKLKKVKHHAALHYDDLPSFMKQLSQAQGLSAKALTLTILCATRTSETLNATWSEIDLGKKTWTIPASRMKAEKEHRIPLSKSAEKLLKDLQANKTSEFIFPGMKYGKPLSNMCMTTLLSRMDRRDITVHGFRSTFRDWIAEKTNYPQRVAETALAHKLKDGAEAAYQRGDLLAKRVELMEAWSRYCLHENLKIVKLRA